jgi:hypothetical protein
MRIVMFTGLLVLATVLVLGGSGVFAQYNYATPKYAAGAMGLQDELKTAITHAGFAAKYDSLNEVTLHLHHVVNCLVGPSGSMFDSGAGNPCQGQGNGILMDIQGMSKDKYNEAWWAAQIANEAITMKNLDQAKAAGRVIVLVLTEVGK